MQEIIDKITSFNLKEINKDSLLATLKTIDVKKVNILFDINNKPQSDYERILINESPVQIYQMLWKPGTSTSIHEHLNFWGYILVLKGTCTEIAYNFDGNYLQKIKEENFHESNIAFEIENAIHKIENKSYTEDLITLNFYFPPLRSLQNTRLFDIEKQRIGILNNNAKFASWNIPPEHFIEIKENSFIYID